MKIGIIGAGAVGMLMASRFSEKNKVVLFTRTKEQADYINKNGIHYTYESKTNTIKINTIAIRDDVYELHSCDIIFVAVKSYSLSSLLSKLKTLKIPIVFTQNGMTHVTFAEEISNSEIYFGSVEHGVRRLSLNEIVRSGSGRIVIGSSTAKRAVNFSEMVPADFPIIEMKDIMYAIESKLVVNMLVNPLTAVHRVTNGELISNETLHAEMIEIFYEVQRILELENDSLLQKTIEICMKTKENRSSMLQDFENGRETEVDAILGYILKRAAKKSIDAPKCEALYRQIKDNT